MDGGVSSAAVEILVQNLIDVLKQEYYLVRDVDEHVQQLQKTLVMIQAYLNDAEKKSITQVAVKIWLRELEAFAFDADNVLDEFSYRLLRKKFKKMKQAPKKKVPSCFSPFKHIAHRRNIAHAIKQINTDFESMNKRASDLGLQSMIVNAPAAAPLVSLGTDSLSQDPILIGRDKDVLKLVDLVNETPHERKLSIFAIVGMGGLGKTTLTREVFNHQKMKTRFVSLIWVHVSQEFDPIVLFNEILSNLTSYTADGVGSREAVLKKLKEALKDKTYLLVLDDVWNEDPHKWGDFMNSMSAVTCSKGNAIIMSSRKEDVASIARPLHTHYLSVLSDDDCWLILKAKAFENGELPSPSSGFEMIGRRIAKRCQGLPLAANVVGGLLLGCKTEEEWGFVNENRLSDVEGGESILKILKLSYDHLASPSLKKCFAYCSIFPKGSDINKQKLIEMWMAEGFLKAGQRNEEMESVGNKFINVLLHNSLLLVSERDEYGNVSSCVMHDLVHDVASFALGSSGGITPLRYTMIHISGNDARPIRKQVAKHLRTLVLKGDISGITFSDFESLRVLTLDDYRVKELPSWIRKLTHLRSLNISHTSIKELPEWIGELHHLQTLRAYTYGMEKMSGMLKYLTNLSNLYIHFFQMEFPAEIGRLTGLQTLDRFTVGDEKGYRIEELGSLNSLKGKLEICDLGKVHGKEEAEKANMSHKPNLLDLKLEWSYLRAGEGETDNDKSVLEGLQPHRNLKKLEIERFKGKEFPSWVEKMAVRDGAQGAWLPLYNLMEITLSWCEECEEIPRLEHLPNLKSLVLRGLEKVRFINSSFTKLTSLCIEDLGGLERLPDWLFYENPNLSGLEIIECPKLRKLPDGMHTLISLEELTIQKCSDLKSIGNNDTSPWKSQGRFLCIEECESMMELPCQMVESWASSLEVLLLASLSCLNNLPMVIDCLAKSSIRLKEWEIYGVPHYSMATQSVESWPFGKLEKLFIDDVSEETSVERMLQGCSSNSLIHLTLKGVGDWENIPESIQHFTALDELALENFGMEELPEWLGNLTSLYSLSLSSCKKLRRLPPGDAFKTLTRLRYLEIKECPELQLHSVRRDLPHLTIRVRSS